MGSTGISITGEVPVICRMDGNEAFCNHPRGCILYAKQGDHLRLLEEYRGPIKQVVSHPLLNGEVYHLVASPLDPNA